MTQIRKPEVSVCIPTFNRAYILEKVIQSVLSQTYKDFELFISDDASSDDTEEVVKSFNDSRIRYHINKNNLGLINNWNFVIKNAKGEYVFKLDDDDYIAATFLEKVVPLFKKHPNIGSVYTGFYYAKGYNGEYIKKVVDKTLFKGDYIRGIDYVKSYLLHTSVPGLHPSSVVFRYDLAKEIGFYEKAKNDLMFSLLLASKANIGYIPEPLFYYVQHQKARATYITESGGSKFPIFDPTRFIEDFFSIDFISEIPELMEIKDVALNRERMVRSVLYLFMSRKAFGLKDYYRLSLNLIKNNRRLLMSPFFVISFFMLFIIPRKLAENISYIYKSKTIFSKIIGMIFMRK